jgi:hypothetical protein
MAKHGSCKNLLVVIVAICLVAHGQFDQVSAAAGQVGARSIIPPHSFSAPNPPNEAVPSIMAAEATAVGMDGSCDGSGTEVSDQSLHLGATFPPIDFSAAAGSEILASAHQVANVITAAETGAINTVTAQGTAETTTTLAPCSLHGYYGTAYFELAFIVLEEVAYHLEATLDPAVGHAGTELEFWDNVGPGSTALLHTANGVYLQHCNCTPLPNPIVQSGVLRVGSYFVLRIRSTATVYDGGSSGSAGYSASLSFSPPSTCQLLRHESGAELLDPQDDCAAEPITDLKSTPGLEAEQVHVSWTAPATPAGDLASAYDLRYSSTPIDDSNFEAATPFYGVPVPHTPGWGELVTVPGLASGTTWYFAIKWQDGAGTWSELSNVPSLLDMGFRTEQDGYGFRNYGGIYPADFTVEDMKVFFGNPFVVCWNGNIGPCIVRPEADRFRRNAIFRMEGGHCLGMTVTGLRIFKGIDSLSQFQSGISTTVALSKTAELRRHIAFYQTRQMANPAFQAIWAQRHKAPSLLVEELRAHLAGPASDPMVLGILVSDAPGQLNGHAMTPYALEERDDHWRIWVYDSNYPGEWAHYVKIDKTGEKWEYNMGPDFEEIWYGDNATHNLGLVPISVLGQTSTCTWCWGSQRAPNQAGGSSNGEIWLNGRGHLLIIDDEGSQLGYVGTQLVADIPGATAGAVYGGLGVAFEPIYTLPLSGTYEIHLDGQTLTQTENVSVVQFGPGYATGISEVLLEPTSLDHLIISPNGDQLSYRPSSSKEITIELAVSAATEGYAFTMSGVEAGAGQPMTATVESGLGELVLDGRNAPAGTYTLTLTRSNASGHHSFEYASIARLAGDIHTVDYGAWDGVGHMALHIDHGGDGVVDEVVQLENQFGRVYLPVINR